MKKQELSTLTDADILEFIDDTSHLAAEQNTNGLSASLSAYHGSTELANNVEFWKWLQRNYSSSEIFNSTSAMQGYIGQGAGKEAWMGKQLQGKGYEWDWMTRQRGSIKNIFRQYDAGDVANRAASDVTEREIFSGKSSEYQMKAYTSKTNPTLSNTPKEMTVVTNSEKVSVVEGNGYSNVQEFETASQIKKNTENRLNEIKKGTAASGYNIRNVGGAMAKAGLIGCAIGAGTEAIFSYKAWKNGQMTDKEYLTEIMKSGGNTGITASATTGVMIPVSSAITVAGMSSLLTIPVAFVLSSAIDKIVAPCFGRGRYKEILNSARYYQNLDSVYYDLMDNMAKAEKQFAMFINEIQRQMVLHDGLQIQSMQLNYELEKLYDSI